VVAVHQSISERDGVLEKPPRLRPQATAASEFGSAALRSRILARNKAWMMMLRSWGKILFARLIRHCSF